MRDSAAVGAFFRGPVRIGVQPVGVVRRVGEAVDARLVYVDPAGHRQFARRCRGQFSKCAGHPKLRQP